MRASSVRATAHTIVTGGDEQGLCHDTSLDQGVREPSATSLGHAECALKSKRPAHPSNRVVAQLNANWRVVDDPLQWILQRRKGKPRTRNSGWRGRSFCRTKDALLGCIGKHCGEVDADALSKLRSLPDWHPDWDRRSQRTNLDVRGTDQARADAQSELLSAQGLKVRGADVKRPRSSQSALT